MNAVGQKTLGAPAALRLPRARRLAANETAVAIVLFALLAAAPLVSKGYAVYILPQYMLFGVLAMSLGLLWGFVGILSFGQGAFFSLGAYTMGLALRHAGAINPGYVGLLVSAGLGALIAGVVGYFLFSAGVRDAFFVIVTLAVSIIFEQIAVSQSQITGGWNGMFIERMELTFAGLGTIRLDGDPPIYYLVLLVAAGVYALLRWITLTRFGKVLVGIRENEERMVSLGFRTSLYKTAAFALSGAIACPAGALYGTHASFVAPSLGGVLFSTEVVVFTAIGGRQSVLGALLGGIVVASLSNYLSAITPRYWQLVLGVLFVAVIAYFKGGVAGALSAFHRSRGG